MDKMKKNRFKIIKEKQLLLIALIIGFISTFFINVANEQSAGEVRQGLASHLIRFHVIANSNSEEDQNLKLKVRDAVLEKMEKLLDSSKSIEQSRQIIIQNVEHIKSIANQVIKANNKNYNVKVSLGNATFPTKTYGDIVLPTGEYEALRIEIGKAEGKNWWCVMFPPLCFVDVTHGVVPDESKQDLKKVLTEEEFNSIIAKSNKEVPVKVKFKIMDLINESKVEKEKDSNIFAILFGGSKY